VTRQVVLDAQLLLLLVVGLVSLDEVGRHRRLSAYSTDDFRLLVDLLGRFDEVVVTPNTLTETSNLLAYGVDGPKLGALREELRNLVERSSELHVPSAVAVAHTEFPRLGLTDSVLLELLLNHGVLVTADLDLYLAAQRLVSVNRSINFNHLRELGYVG
jgi:hypothetical protein